MREIIPKGQNFGNIKSGLMSDRNVTTWGYHVAPPWTCMRGRERNEFIGHFLVLRDVLHIGERAGERKGRVLLNNSKIFKMIQILTQSARNPLVLKYQPKALATANAVHRQLLQSPSVLTSMLTSAKKGDYVFCFCMSLTKWQKLEAGSKQTKETQYLAQIMFYTTTHS